MQFLYPYFFIAFLSLVIPILIHLFYFRRFKKVYFTNVRFLKELKEETSTRSKVKQLLILLSRLLALAFLILAFIQPFIPKDIDVKQGTKAVSVFVDNSFSMSSLGEKINLLENAKAKATEIIEAYRPQERFQVLTNDFEGKHQRMVSKEEALSYVKEIKISSSVQDLKSILIRQNQALNTAKSDNKISYIISDFQKNITNIKEYKDTSVQINLIPLQPVQVQNISIDSCWFEMPVQMINQSNNLYVKLTNHSPEPVDNVKLSIKYDGQDKPVGSASIAGNSSITDTISLTTTHTGWHETIVQIVDYPVQFDDQYFISFNVDEKLKVCVINDGNINKYLNALFKGIQYFDVNQQNSKNIDYASLPQNKMIILQDVASISSGLANELSQFVKDGGNLLIFPPENADLASYKNLSNILQINTLNNFEKSDRIVSEINTNEFVFSDVFKNKRNNLKLPQTKGNYMISNSSAVGEELLLTYRDGRPFVSKYNVDKGLVYLCASPIDENYSDLVRNAEVFVPMLFKMTISQAIRPAISYTIGKDQILEANFQNFEKDKVMKMKGLKEEFIPEQKLVGSKLILNIANQIPEAGFYNLYLDGNKLVQKFAYNYDRRESNMLNYSLSDLKLFENNHIKLIDDSVDANFTQLIGQRDQGISLWKWCLILSLLFLLIESLLVRFFR
ncbi:MAG: BatA domain-containing protein [Saprospiraceae bacterium]|nr:BatA domain-containing protein [Saprospiraceae bacterium]